MDEVGLVVGLLTVGDESPEIAGFNNGLLLASSGRMRILFPVSFPHVVR